MLDTSVLIDAERRSLNIKRMLDALPLQDEEHVAVSAVTVMELAQGIAEARTKVVLHVRQKFLDILEPRFQLLRLAIRSRCAQAI